MTEETTTPDQDQTPESSEAAPADATETTPITEEPSQAASEDSSSKTEVQPDQEAQPTDDAKPAEEAKEAEPEDKPADRIVPEVSDYKLPEGMPQEIAQFAKDTDMTQDQLDKTLSQFSSFVTQNEQFKQEQLKQSGLDFVETWGKQKEYNLSLVRRALKQNDSEGKLEAMLNESGFGNHPAVLSFFLNIGNSMKEGGFLKGANNTQSKAGLSAAQAMFGNHPSSN